MKRQPLWNLPRRVEELKILWTLLITAVSAHKVIESTEDIGPEHFQNVTTLYPISSNNTFTIINDVTNNKLSDNDETNKTGNNNNSNTDSKGDKAKLDATVWKIEAAFAESNLDKREKENITEVDKKENCTKEFRPSPHLGNFYEEDNLRTTPPSASFDPFMPVKKPSTGFVSSSKDEFRSSFNNIPKQIFQTHKQYPYKYETPILTQAKDSWSHESLGTWRERPDSLQSRPTAEVPVKVPAGGFYKYEDPFKNPPGKDDFGLGFNEDGKDSSIKKRANPWESFLRLVTAFLPVGLIISALTPSIITVENTGPGPYGNTYPSNIFRRSDPGLEPPAAGISERCRRRLICELRAEKYYNPQNSSPTRGKSCYKIHCEDTAALAHMLQWLLEYKQAVNRHYT